MTVGYSLVKLIIDCNGYKLSVSCNVIKKNKKNVGGAMHFIYYINRLTCRHESRFNLFGLLNQQYTVSTVSVYVCGRARTHDHRVGSQRFILAPHRYYYCY